MLPTFFAPEVFTVALFIERPKVVHQVLDDEEVRTIYTSMLEIPGYVAVSKNISDMEQVNSVVLLTQYRSVDSLTKEAQKSQTEASMKQEEDLMSFVANNESALSYLCQYKRKAKSPLLKVLPAFGVSKKENRKSLDSSALFAL